MLTVGIVALAYIIVGGILGCLLSRAASAAGDSFDVWDALAIMFLWPVHVYWMLGGGRE